MRRLPEVAEHQFNDDAPRENRWTDDDLGFGPFSQRVALALVRQEVKRGYVFGLHGEWGSGKQAQSSSEYAANGVAFLHAKRKGKVTTTDPWRSYIFDSRRRAQRDPYEAPRNEPA